MEFERLLEFWKMRRLKLIECLGEEICFPLKNSEARYYKVTSLSVGSSFIQICNMQCFLVGSRPGLRPTDPPVVALSTCLQFSCEWTFCQSH